MAEFYDALETRDPAAREAALFARLPETVALAMTAPGWARQLAGVEPRAVTSRGRLAELPVLRKSSLIALQRQAPPFGGFNVTPAGKMLRLMMSPGPVYEPEAADRDGWGAARALFAAGFRPGDILLNTFSYHLSPGGLIMESGALALGCAVIPAGPGNTEQQLAAIAQLRPAGYVGTPDFLKILLDAAEKAGSDASSLDRALVSGAALPASLRAELAGRGVAVRSCYATADFGVVAYETATDAGMVVNESLILEIVRPGTGDPVAAGEVGEVVVTSLRPDYPLIRLATGDLSALVAGPSPCGRTGLRIAGWMGRADQATKVKGLFIRPEQVAELARRHPELGRIRVSVTRAGDEDAMTVLAECAAPAAGLDQAVAATLRSVSRLRGLVRLVPPGTLPNDGKVIADEREIA
jgi:phenylacetate-CoA ligase